jgi:hypothetical protein
MAEVAAARSTEQPTPRKFPIHWKEIDMLLLRLRSALPRPRPVRFQMKKGSGWLRAAGACGAAMALTAILLWGDGGPQIADGRATWGPSIWHLPDGLVLALLVVLFYGVPFTAILTLIGFVLRVGPRAALWVAGFVVLGLVLSQ